MEWRSGQGTQIRWQAGHGGDTDEQDRRRVHHAGSALLEVWTLDDRDPDAPSCTTDWSIGPALSEHANGEFVARVRAIDCAKSTPLVAPLVAALKEKPDAGDPQRPLLYAPGEPDHP